MIEIECPTVGKRMYNHRQEAKADDFLDFINKECGDVDIKIVGEVVSAPTRAPQYKYKKHGDWTKEKGWAYFITIGDHVIKIGMTDSTLASRFSSYQAGTLKAREKGTCSVTNYHVSEVLRTVLASMGDKVKIYALKVPHCEIEQEVLGESQIVRQKMAHVYETRLLSLYKKFTGRFPCLSNNTSEE